MYKVFSSNYLFVIASFAIDWYYRCVLIVHGHGIGRNIRMLHKRPSKRRKLLWIISVDVIFHGVCISVNYSRITFTQSKKWINSFYVKSFAWFQIYDVLCKQVEVSVYVTWAVISCILTAFGSHQSGSMSGWLYQPQTKSGSVLIWVPLLSH